MKYEDMENQIISAIETIKSTYGIKGIHPYNGELAVEDIIAISYRFPAVYVYIEGFTNEASNTRDIRVFTVHVFVADKALRQTSDTMHGVFSIMEGIRGVLHRRRLFANYSELILINEKIISLSGDFAIMKATYNFKGLV